MNSGTLLFRQISPSWVQGDRVTSQAFTPTPKDEGQLSVYDGDRVTAKESWQHFTGTLGLKSAGVLAVTVAECQSQGTPTQPDPEAFLEHVLIDFRALTNSQKKAAGKALARCANTRGWQHGPVVAQDMT